MLPVHGKSLLTRCFCQDVSWLTPQSEYRPTEFLQHWVSFWFNDEKRLAAAKVFQLVRLDQIEKHWLSPRMQREDSFTVNCDQLVALLNSTRAALNQCKNNSDILDLPGCYCHRWRPDSIVFLYLLHFIIF